MCVVPSSELVSTGVHCHVGVICVEMLCVCVFDVVCLCVCDAVCVGLSLADLVYRRFSIDQFREEKTCKKGEFSYRVRESFGKI